MRLHQFENARRLLARCTGIELDAELIVQAGVTGSARDLVLGHRQPLYDVGHRRRLGGQPSFAAPLARQVDEDRLAIAQHDVAVDKDGNLAKPVQIDQRALLVRAGEKVDRDDLQRHA